jgi:hypothetical protein
VALVLVSRLIDLLALGLFIPAFIVTRVGVGIRAIEGVVIRWWSAKIGIVARSAKPGVARFFTRDLRRHRRDGHHYRYEASRHEEQYPAAQGSHCPWRSVTAGEKVILSVIVLKGRRFSRSTSRLRAVGKSSVPSPRYGQASTAAYILRCV